jgi:hypothetical protein
MVLQRDKLINMVKKINAYRSRKLLQLKLLAELLRIKLKGNQQETGPKVWLDLSVDYERYIYTLCKLFELEGYQVYIKANPRFLVKLTNRFASRIITEGKVIFTNKKPDLLAATFSDRSGGGDIKFISMDYFATIFDKNPNSYHIPIGLHPDMYRSGLWNAAIHQTKRKQSIFFAGTFMQRYGEMSQDRRFEMPDRLQLFNMLKSLPNATFPKSYNELAENSNDGQIDVVSLDNFIVPQDILRQTIAGYTYFIACPGFIMPQSHNVYEAMSVGTIPIIHRQYARMFHPKLEDNKTAILYGDNFIEKIQEALQIKPEQLYAMEAQVRNYYNTYLTPKVVVSQLIAADKTTYFLNSEKNSVLLMK